MNDRLRARLVVLALLGALLLNYPLLSLFAGGSLLAGFPLLYVYIFVAWAAVIVAMALALRHTGADEEPPDG